VEGASRPRESAAEAADCWLVRVYLTPEEAQTLSGMQ
jgi:hypothetical protein